MVFSGVAVTVGRQEGNRPPVNGLATIGFILCVKTRDFGLSALPAIPPKPSRLLFVTHPRRPMVPTPPFSVRGHAAYKRLPCVHTKVSSPKMQGTSCALCLSRISLLRLGVERGMLFGRYLRRPFGPPLNLTHAMGSWPSPDRFAVRVSASSC